MAYPLDIHVWPHSAFGYYSKGHHAVYWFRQALAQRGVEIENSAGDWWWGWARVAHGELCIQTTQALGAFPVTVWSVAG